MIIFLHFMLNAVILFFVCHGLAVFINNFAKVGEESGFRAAVVDLLAAIVFCLLWIGFK
jgi:hypothetical protein